MRIHVQKYAVDYGNGGWGGGVERQTAAAGTPVEKKESEKVNSPKHALLANQSRVPTTLVNLGLDNSTSQDPVVVRNEFHTDAILEHGGDMLIQPLNEREGDCSRLGGTARAVDALAIVEIEMRHLDAAHHDRGPQFGVFLHRFFELAGDTDLQVAVLYRGCFGHLST